MKWTRGVFRTAAVFCALALLGCTSVSDDASPTASPEIDDALNELTREEFMDMMLEMEQCYKDHGADAEIFGWNPADDRRIVHRLNTSAVDSETASKVEHECLDGGPSSAMTYFLEQDDPGMDPEFREGVISCLATRGHDLPDDVRNHYEMEEAGASRSDISACINSEMERLDEDLYLYFGGVQW